MPDLTSLDKKAQKALAASLDGSEEVRATQPGESSALVATDRRILVCKWGLTSGAFFGSQVNSWDVAHVTGIEYHQGITTKAIVIQTAGAQIVDKFGRMDTGPTSVWQAPNALFVSSADAEATVSILREMISDHHRVGRASRAPSHPPEIGVLASADEAAEQIRRFADLRDEGLISDEEFQAKKKIILGL